MSLYRDDKEEIKEMINKAIVEAQIKPSKLFSDEIKESILICFTIITIAILFFVTIMYTSNQKTIRTNIQTFGEYNNSIVEENNE